MTSTTEAAPRQAVAPRRWLPALAAAAGVALLVAARTADLGDVAVVGTLGVVFVSIVVEALPFILLGAGVSAALATFVSDAWFRGLARAPRALQVPGAAAAGACFPVCECGSVPVARRLLSRGVDQAAAITFMLAAPVLNPIVLGSTWIAYEARGQALEMTAARAGLGLVVAIAVGLVVARVVGGGGLLRLSADAEGTPAGADGDGLIGRDADGGRTSVYVGHLTDDFLFMGRYLVLGAAVAAAIQTLLPQDLLAGIGGAPVVAVLTMMLLAFALSLCSEADAFVAVSFTAFPVSAQLGFLVLGPVLDAKLAFLYGATFRDRFVVVLVLVAIPLTVVGSLLLGGLIV